MINIEYIEGTGTQWIDTGIKPSTTTLIKAGIMSIAATGGAIIGHCYSDNSDYRLFNYSNTAYFDYSSGRLSGNRINDNTYYDVEMGNYYLKLNGTTVLSGSAQGSGDYQNHNINLLYSQQESSRAKARIYYIQIYNGGNLVLDAIPVKDENNVVCMYDSVSDSYLYNQGTGDFTPGPAEPSGPLTPQEVLNLAMTDNTYTNADGHTFVASASSTLDSPRQPYKPFNGTASTGEYDCWHPNSGVPQWLKLKLDAPMIIKGFTMKNRNANVEHPTAITFQGSNDNSTWDDLAQISWTEQGSGLTKNVTVPSYNQGYIYFRWYITAVTSSPYGVIAKITFTDVEAPTSTKYLIESGGDYYTISGGVLTNVGNTLNAQLFSTYGMSDAPDWSDYSSLSNPSVLCWNSDDFVDMIATTTGLPQPQIITSSGISLTTQGTDGINSIAISQSGSPQYAFSVDDGLTYKVWSGSAWVASTGTDMSKANVEALTNTEWSMLTSGANFLKVRFKLSAASDAVESITITYKQA